MIEPLAFHVAGSSESIFWVDEGAGKEIALIIDGLLVAADFLRGEEVEVVKVTVIRRHAVGYSTLHWHVYRNQIGILPVYFNIADVLGVTSHVYFAFGEDEIDRQRFLYQSYQKHKKEIFNFHMFKIIITALLFYDFETVSLSFDSPCRCC